MALTATMLVMALIMTVTSTFAWVTLSTAPEVSNISTTVAANGSLEIALEDGNNETEPQSNIGDSSSVDGDVVRANITWGNLVNLSDESYGLNQIVLRPARLNEASLAKNPLWGAVYGSDGRISTLNTDYTFATFSEGEEKFLVSSSKGVRAISSYGYTATSAEVAEALEKINRVRQPVLNAISAVSSQYSGNVMTVENIEGLRGLLSAYVSGAAVDGIKKIQDDSYNGNAAGGTDITPYLAQIYSLYNELYRAMELEQEALTALANLQRYVDSLQTGGEAYSELTWRDLAAAPSTYDAATSTGNVKLTGLSTFVTETNQASKDLATLRNYYQNSQAGSTYTYSQIEAIVNRLAGPRAATINGKPVTNMDISTIGALFSNPRITLNSGYLKDFEELAVQASSRMNVTMSISVEITGIEEGDSYYAIARQVSQMGIENANVVTSANGTCSTEQDAAAASDSDNLNIAGATLAAEDTYGLALDIWVRTNNMNSYLILQGAPELDDQRVRVMGTDGSGNSVELYTATISVDDNQVNNVDVYTANDTWYYNKTNNPVTVVGTPAEKYETLVTVTGYSGVNRVWNEEDALLTEDSTTQGAGSCYVFYADTPEDQARFTRVLNAMSVVFTDQQGNLLNTAYMDTDHAFAEAGKVTVPVVIRNSTKIATTEEVEGETVTTYQDMLDADGNVIYGIMPLQKNVATLVTAILYLDGDKLTNADVQTANEMQGTLNLQLGSTPAIHAAEDSALMNATRSISASATGETDITYDGNAHTVSIQVTVDGDAPAKVTAAFQRRVNETQGKRMEVVTFTADGEDRTTWDGSFSFTAPGTYVLRDVQLDGVDYTLPQPVEVTVSGFSISSAALTSDPSVFTVESSYSAPVAIGFSDAYTPNNVRLVFENESGGTPVGVALQKDGEQYRGVAAFTTSGTYTMAYAEVDGEYYDLGSFKKSISLSLGLSAKVNTSSPTREYYAENTSYGKLMSVQVLDNGGNAMENLSDVNLVYSRGGSVSDTLTAQLTWNSASGRYTGTLPLVQPGTYTFLRLTVGSSSIARTVGDSPVFYLRNSDPVSYVTTSASTYHGDGVVQYVPLSNNAYIGPIRINNSGTAYVSAVVHNSVTNEDYEVLQSSANAAAGKLYYDAGAWYINLPTYQDNQGDTSQDGTWTVKSITLWDVVDVNGVTHNADNKLTWTDGDGYDFSALSTTVSSTLSVTMTPGVTALGSSTTSFMTNHSYQSDVGASVTVQDNTGFVIPAARLRSIQLHLRYEDNKDVSYGYTVTGYTCSPTVTFGTFSEEVWRPSNDISLQYVGEYTVTDLTVTMVDGTSLVLKPGESGVPAKYTVTSKAPSADDVALTVTQSATTFGKSGDTVTGAFLAAYNPGVTVRGQVKYTDTNGNTQIARYADFSGIESAAVTLAYRASQGKQAPNGGYSWTGTSAYETVTLGTAVNNSGAYTTSNAANGAGASPLLAGTYDITAVSVTVNGESSTLTGEDLSGVAPIEVYSKSPTVTITNAVSKISPVYSPFETNRNAGTENNTAAEYSLHMTENEISEDGYTATLRFVTHKTSESSYQAGVPSVTMVLSDMGSAFTGARLTVPNNTDNSDVVFSLKNNVYSGNTYIGRVNGQTSSVGNAVTFHFVGTQTVHSLAVTGPTGDNAVYTVSLAHDLTIHQNPEPDAALKDVPVELVNGDHGEHVSLTIVETRQDNTVVNHAVAAGDASFTVQEGASLTITANADEGYQDAVWALHSDSLQTTLNDTTYKPRYETCTENVGITTLKDTVTITKSCTKQGQLLDFYVGTSTGSKNTMKAGNMKLFYGEETTPFFTYNFTGTAANDSYTATGMDINDVPSSSGSGVLKKGTATMGRFKIEKDAIIRVVLTDVQINKTTGTQVQSIQTFTLNKDKSNGLSNMYNTKYYLCTENGDPAVANTTYNQTLYIKVNADGAFVLVAAAGDSAAGTTSATASNLIDLTKPK